MHFGMFMQFETCNCARSSGWMASSQSSTPAA